MIQKFYKLKVSTNGQKLYEFTDKTLQWIKENEFNNGLIAFSINSEVLKLGIATLILFIS